MFVSVGRVILASAMTVPTVLQLNKNIIRSTGSWTSHKQYANSKW